MASKYIIGFIAGSVCTCMMMKAFESFSAANINLVFNRNELKKNVTRFVREGRLVQNASNVTTASISATANFQSLLLLTDGNPANMSDTISSSMIVMYRDRWTDQYYSPPSPPGDGRTTVIICSSLIPSHPSIWMINRTIDSIAQYVVDLEPNYELIVAVDGLKSGANQTDAVRLSRYVKILCSAFPRVQIVGGYNTNTSIGLSRNVVRALNATETEFVYLLQHDMPFRKTIDHAGLSSMVRDVADQYPFNVRFNKKANLVFGNKRGKCFNVNNQLTYHNASGLKFLKTSTWSDNNQFATAVYYRRMFATQVNGVHLKNPMEFRMQHVAEKDSKNNSCLGYAQYLYGPMRDGPYVDHLDGRNNAAVHR